jgi:hypothetical protein
MREHPTVTWLLPVRNGMPFLPDTLASLAAQTRSDFEVLAWDNGSTDGSEEMLREWIPSRLPGRVVTGRVLDLGACLAAMVEETSTEFCARIDADDVCAPERLERQLDFLARHPDVVLVGAQVRRLGADGVVGDRHYEMPCRHEDILLRLMREWAVWHPTVVFRRAAVLAAGNYKDERPVEDYGLWLRLARVGRLANLPECLVDYRVHEQSITGQAQAAGSLREKVVGSIAGYGREIYGLPAERLSALAENVAPPTPADLLAIACGLLRRGHATVVGLLRSRRWWRLVREAVATKHSR